MKSVYRYIQHKKQLLQGLLFQIMYIWNDFWLGNCVFWSCMMSNSYGVSGVTLMCMLGKQCFHLTYKLISSDPPSIVPKYFNGMKCFTIYAATTTHSIPPKHGKREVKCRHILPLPPGEMCCYFKRFISNATKLLYTNYILYVIFVYKKNCIPTIAVCS